MACCDCAEVYKLVGSFVSSELENVVNKDNIGLHRDDGLVMFQNMSKMKTERKKRKL